MFATLSAKYHQENKQRLKKNKKSSNMVLNIRKISQKTRKNK